MPWRSCWQLLYNAPDLADVGRLRGDAGGQLRALQPEIDRLISAINDVEGVRSVTYLVESVLPSFYLPGYGLKGVPLYLVGDDDGYLQNVYHEPEVGISSDFVTIMDRLKQGQTASSPPVSEFWRLDEGAPRPARSGQRAPGADCARGRHSRVPAGHSPAIGD